MDIKACLAVVAIVIAIFASRDVEGRPQTTDGWTLYHSRYTNGNSQHRRAINACESQEGVRELCQRCAKATKSRLAYPMCCEMRENTLTWCTKFLNTDMALATNSIDK